MRRYLSRVKLAHRIPLKNDVHEARYELHDFDVPEPGQTTTAICGTCHSAVEIERRLTERHARSMKLQDAFYNALALVGVYALYDTFAAGTSVAGLFGLIAGAQGLAILASIFGNLYEAAIGETIHISGGPHSLRKPSQGEYEYEPKDFEGGGE